MTPAEIAKAVWERTITNHWRNNVPSWTLLRDIHEMVEKQPERFLDNARVDIGGEVISLRRLFGCLIMAHGVIERQLSNQRRQIDALKELAAKQADQLAAQTGKLEEILKVVAQESNRAG